MCYQQAILLALLRQQLELYGDTRRYHFLKKIVIYITLFFYTVSPGIIISDLLEPK